MYSLLRSLSFLFVISATIGIATATQGCGGSDGSSCCKTCTTGKACGDSCISRDYDCHEGSGCACNGSYVPNVAKAARPPVGAVTYEGPAGLHYEAGQISGALSKPRMSMEFESGQSVSLYWEHILLGALVPDLRAERASFESAFNSDSCTALAKAFVNALTQLNGDDHRMASLRELEAMGFPQLDSLETAHSIADLSRLPEFLEQFGVGLETYGACE